MRVHKQPGTKGRLFEMMANVNKVALNEADDASGLSYDASHPSNHPEVEYVTLEQTFDRLVDKFKGKNEMPTKWDVMGVVGRHDYEDWLNAGLLAWKIANNVPVEETDFRGVSDFVVKHAKEKYLSGVKEDFDYHGAEMDQLGQQDLEAHQQEELSKELAMSLKNSPDEFKQKVATLQQIPAYVHQGGAFDGNGNPLSLGFRDLEDAGLVQVHQSLQNWGNGEDDAENELNGIVSTSDIPIYGIDTKKLYQKGDRII